MTEDIDLFAFSQIIEDSSFWLRKEPENSRILRLMQDKLNRLSKSSSNKDIIFIADFLNSYINQLWNNLAVDFTYQSGSTGRKILISLMKGIGHELNSLTSIIREGKDYHIVLLQLSNLYQQTLTEIREKEEIIRNVEVTIGKVTKPNQVSPRLKQLCQVVQESGAITQSVYTLAGGSPSDYFLDADKMMSKPEFVEILSGYYAKEIRKAMKSCKIDKLAFIEKKVGTVGILPLMGLIILKTKLNGIVVRVQKQVEIGKLKYSLGVEPKHGEAIAIVSDVATAGEGTIEAATAIRVAGASVPFVFVFYDREQGARELLAKNDIQLRTVTSYTELARFGLVPPEKGPILSDLIPIPPQKIRKYFSSGDLNIPKEEKKILVSFNP